MVGTLRRGLVIAVAIGGTLVAAGSASANVGCAASAVRIVSAQGTIEPVRANPGLSPCVDGFQSAASLPISAGILTVTAAGASAQTNVNLSTPCCFFFEHADSHVGSVTLSVGSVTISASALDAVASFGGPTCHDCFPGGGAFSSLGEVSINGSAVFFNNTPTDVPIAGVGTLHIDWTNAGGSPPPPGGPPATSRALWLQGNPGVPDVVVAEARACDGSNTFVIWPCP